MTIESDTSTNLTACECEELASALFEDAAGLPPGPKKQEILKLARGYRSLGKMKGWVSQNVS